MPTPLLSFKVPVGTTVIQRTAGKVLHEGVVCVSRLEEMQIRHIGCCPGRFSIIDQVRDARRHGWRIVTCVHPRTRWSKGQGHIYCDDCKAYIREAPKASVWYQFRPDHTPSKKTAWDQLDNLD